jgi:hypothetical protein
MHDDELEATLRRYRAREPSAELRARVLVAAEEETAEIPWYWGPIAAAAILFLWFAAHASRIEPERDPLREAAIALMTETLGGGEDVRRYVEVALLPEPVEEQQ